MRSFLHKITLLLLFSAARVAVAQVKFSAGVSAPQISKNELVQIKFTVENAREVEHITPPAFKNFTVVSGPNQESGMTMVNGDVKQFIALSYVLQPKSPGNFTIGAATAKADGKELRSNAVSIQVSNTLAANNSGGSSFSSPFGGMDPFADAAPEAPFRDNILKKGENAADKVNKNMFIKLELDKTSCYIGEPVIATYKLYTRLKSESNLVKNPSFNGFSVIDLQRPDNMTYKREKVNGREYNVYVIRKAQLYPLQSGKLDLEPAEIENNVSFIKEEYANRQNNLMSDVFREFEEATIPAEGMENHKVTLQSQPASVMVKPLPEANVPAAFKGAVGNFSIEAVLEKNNFTTDDAGKLRIIISGQGNLQLVNNPEIQWPKGFEAFEPSATDDFLKTSVPVSGRKIIDYSFTVEAPGSYTLPAVKFSYFDAKEGKYKTDSTKPISFTVAKGTGKKATAIVTDTKPGSDNFLNKFISNRRWVISTVAVLIICGLLFWVKRDTKKEAVMAEEKAKADAVKAEEQKIAASLIVEEKNWLEKANELLTADSTAFYIELNFALKSYLSKKLQLPVETINKKNINEELDKKNIAVATTVQLQQLMNDIELQLYTPFPEKEKMQELYDSTAAIIQLLDTYKN
ncbi:BatD family protein [Ferruginibacter sp. SUN106]|uniref:BatD family protein n=1 Tax=Ferruginibacter sp. SUN106 TaxID=2978348 RepID=UPI003D361E9B